MSIPLRNILPRPDDLLALTPEDLGGVIIEVLPSFEFQMMRGMFNVETILFTFYPSADEFYPQHTKSDVSLAVSEAFNWLSTQGLIVIDPSQPSLWYRLSRRAKELRYRVDVEAFRKGRILPDELMPSLFQRKVVPLFRRGDYDVAVFQAFKEVEVAVRDAANAKGAGFADTEIGTSLMRKAFHTDNGLLSDLTLASAEREAMMHLFSGAIGHAKNPTSHRNVTIAAQEASRLITFASYLLDIVEKRLAG